MYQAQLSAMKRDYQLRETTVEISTMGLGSVNPYFGFAAFGGDAADADFGGGGDTEFDAPCSDSDRLYRNITGYCNNIRRPTQGEENPREQQNLLTAFIDGSSVYGSDVETEERLRGRNEIRLHNTIVQKLDDNTDWDGERLYQETRKIVGAILQRITYLEFLPEIFNKRTLRKYNLKDGNYKYNINIDPSIANVFATAAFRFGHSLIPDFLVIDGEKVRSRKLFNNPKFIFEKLKALVKSVLYNPSETVDRFLTKEITDHLFEVDDLSFDLAAFNIQRGRDHGLPPYNTFRRLCGLNPVVTFYSKQLGSGGGAAMARIYRTVDDIDVFAGGLAEPPLRGSQLGPTFTCILAQQFRDLKFGDSFWHETKDRKRGFKSDQLESLKRISLAKIICEEIGLDRIQRNPFRVVTNG
ncbi:peroxidase-like protein 3 [Patella vulgata]|uniref:peroxidase-like protein 3 n=1 Tax=Patella vulgata TaxID=6465 RepID=UPI0024A93186|nr:peroxidase-like protein 3 [Patella vulgata]